MWKFLDSQGRVKMNALPFPALATALPSSPKDGDQIVLTDSTSAPTYQWLLQYVSAKASNKWVCLGGAAKLVKVDTSEGTTSASYTDLSTVGPSFTAPVAGLYEVTIDAELNPNNAAVNTGARAALKIGSAAAADTESIAAWARDGTSGRSHHSAATFSVTAAASDVLKIQYKADGTNNWNFLYRHLRVIPISLGG